MDNSRDLDIVSKEVENVYGFIQKLIAEISKIIVGQKYLIERLIIGLLSEGHVLVEGVPGLAKTLAISTISKAVNGSFSRIQFTPDLLPADITGTLIYDMKSASFIAKKGPIFSNFILADEINRTPPKVQSALLEAMQEKQVTIGDTTYKLPYPFIVMATQNPIEQEGTYPLPEAETDRFMLKLNITYPEPKEEIEIVDRVVCTGLVETKTVMDIEKIREIARISKKIYIDEKIKKYIVDIVDATRNPEKYELSEIKPFIKYGGSPRASIYLAIGSRTIALLKSRAFVIPEDVKEIAHDVLRHRILLTYEAEAEDVNSDKIIDMILENVEIP